MSTLKCSYQPNQPKPKKRQLTESRREQLKKRAAWFQSTVNKAGSTAQAYAQRVSMARMLNAHSHIDLHDMTGKKANSWQRWLAVVAGENVGDVGKFRRTLYENKRYAQGVLQALTNQATVEAIRPLTKRFKELMKARGVDTALSGKLMTDLFETGRTPITLQVHGKSRGVEELLTARNQKFVNDMKAAGFADNDIDELVSLAHRAGLVYDDMMAQMESLGYNIGKLENIEYLPRIFSREAEDVFRQMKELPSQANSFGTKGTDTPDFGKSRKSHWYTAEDHTALADVLGVTPEELTGIIADTSTFKSYIENSLSDEYLDMLVDAGVMGKVPMSSSEFYEWYSTRYDLPFKSFEEMFVTNPERILNGYKRELEDAAGNWGMARSLADDGQTQGLFVDETQALRDGVENFVPVSSMASADILKQSGIDGAAYMHKDVAAVVDAAMSIERNPNSLSMVAKAWMKLNNLIKTQLLTSPQYVARIFISNTFMYATHGGEAHELLTSLDDMFKYMVKGLNAFDDSKPYRVMDGKNVTHREFVREFATRRLNNITPMFDGNKRPTPTLDPLNPALIPKKLGLITRMVLSRDTAPEMLGQLGKEAANVSKDFINAVFAPFGFSANFLEAAFKLGLYKSVTKRGDAWDGVRKSLRLASTGEHVLYDDTLKALEHVDRAFLTMDDIGTLPGTISKYVVPFYSYTWKSTSGILRDALRNPTKYMTYARVGSLVYERWEEQQDLTQAETFEPLTNDVPITVYKDDEGRAVMLSLTNVHPLLGFMINTNENVEKVARLFGVEVGTAKEVRDMLSAKYGIKTDEKNDSVAQKLSDFLGNTYYSSFNNILQGHDQKGKKVDDERYNTFLGVEMSQTTENIIGTVLPLLRTLNRYNPGGAFGKREERTGEGTWSRDGSGNWTYDGKGEVTREGKSSIFGTERTEMDNKDLVDAVTNDPAVRVAQLAGLSFSYNDTGRNLKYSHTDIVKSQEQVAVAITQLQKQKASGTLKGLDDQEYTKKLNDLTTLWGMFEYDKLRVQAYMQKRGITSREFDNKVKDRKIALQGIPVLKAKDLHAIQQEMEKLNNVNN